MNKFKGQGLALKQFRKECGFTNQEVVDRVGKSPMWLSDIENGKRNIFFKKSGGNSRLLVAEMKARL